MRTRKVRELRLKQQLMEEAVHSLVHPEVVLMDPLEQPAAPAVTVSPVATLTIPAVPTKPHRAHKRHGPGTKADP